MFRQGELVNLRRFFVLRGSGEKWSRAVSRRRFASSERWSSAMNSQVCERRDFFSRAAVLSAGALFVTPATAAQESRQRTIGLGFSLYGAKSLSLSEALRAVAEVGYDCVEIPVMPDWPADSASLSLARRNQLASELTESRLSLSALMENLPALGQPMQHAAHVERLKRAAELARALLPAADRSLARSPVIETIVGGRAGEFELVQERLIERLRDYAAVVADAEVVLAVKAHVGNAIQRPEQLTAVLDAVASPWLKAAYDYSHFELQDLEMRATTQALLPRSVFVHVKDTERAQGKRGFLLPGEGTTDYVALFELIGQSNYQGDVVVEVSSQVSGRAGYEAQAAMRKCYNHLSKSFIQAGLSRK
jgi:inosose dehydratase